MEKEKKEKGRVREIVTRMEEACKGKKVKFDNRKQLKRMFYSVRNRFIDRHEET